jgi:hypothetical protein
VRAAPELLGALTMGGGSARPRGGGRESLGSQIKPPEIYKNGGKTGGFTHFLAYKSL